MSVARSLRKASRDELRERIVTGYPVDATAIEGWAYRGTSVGLPGALERFTWKTFQKTFWREPATGRLLGWNVRLEQDGIDAPSRPMMQGGKPLTTWHYEVVEPSGVATPPGFDRGLIIDYSLGANPPYEPVRLGKDPLVALAAGANDELIGVTYLAIGSRCIETPTYFLLERDHPIDYVPYLDEPSAERAGTRSATRLRSFERAWAEALFEAVLPGDDDTGLPPFAAVDRDRFWHCLEHAPAPSFGLGLRGIVYALTLLPAMDPRFRRPFHRLDPDARAQLLDELAVDGRYTVRQMVTMLKTLGCLAYFDDPDVRRRVGVDPPGSEVSP